MVPITLLGVKIAAKTREEIRSQLVEFLHSAGLKQIATVNPEFLVTADRDKEFKNILSSVALAVPDGSGIIYLAKLTRQKISLAHRFTGVDLTHDLLQLAEAEQKSVEIILPSDSLSTKEEIYTSIVKLYSKAIVRIFREDEVKEGSPRADIVLVALGAPEQEKWIWNHRETLLGTKIALGVGGTFDFISGKIQRAPIILRSVGLEWLWRLYQEPRRRFRRIVRAVVVFPWLVLRETLNHRNSHPE